MVKHTQADTAASKGELDRSVKLHTAGFLTGAAIAVEEDRSVAEVIQYGVAGALTTLLFEVLFPKSAGVVKRML